ncbi:MAG TPA: peroxide stress protein YaaA [Caulobacteraceae bacterium]|jgi:cytoplasmic iron level regulating protein YaaA (DUF328/UPF0246 family)|nr:peroxide stress protein YaaA [Caulobacteraceae bacterium]
MLFVLSPAKTLDFTPGPAELPATAPQMRGDIARLARTTRQLKAADLKRLMDISDALAELNVARFKAFAPKAEDAGVQAALAFAGDVYLGLQARTLDAGALAWAQDRLRILSGLYGILRPLDRIQPYRLEMGTRLATDRGSNLYDFWGDRLSKALNAAAKGHEDRTLVNLASQEYFGAVDAHALKLPLVTCHFKQEQDGLVRNLAFYAKTARGLMARFAIEGRVEHARDLKAFDAVGYRFRPDLSDARDWVFSRPHPLGASSPP